MTIYAQECVCVCVYVLAAAAACERALKSHMCDKVIEATGYIMRNGAL